MLMPAESHDWFLSSKISDVVRLSVNSNDINLLVFGMFVFAQDYLATSVLFYL